MFDAAAATATKNISNFIKYYQQSKVQAQGSKREVVLHQPASVQGRCTEIDDDAPYFMQKQQHWLGCDATTASG